MSPLPAPAPIVARTPAEVASAINAMRGPGRSVGFAPTMGALHAGHAELVKSIAARGDISVASIFVNPTQFGPNEDLARYPRDEAGDLAVLAVSGCHIAYAPAPQTMYPPGFASRIQVDGPSAGLETDVRPHFFSGVATVVAKLLLQVRPDYAVFGEKDYQQLLVVRRLAADLDLGVRIEGLPTVRESDGLAMSSRNRYLDPAARAAAAALPSALGDAVQRLEAGQDPAPVTQHVVERLRAAGFTRIDYVDVRDAATLGVLGPGPVDRPARILAAAVIGGARLIDNWPVNPA